MRRRVFLALFGGVAAAAWPAAADAQKDARVRRIGVLMGAANDAEGQTRLSALKQGMQDLKWVEGASVTYSIGWAAGDAALARSLVEEMVGSAPDLIVGINSPMVRALKTATDKIPIVFAGLADPVGDGIVTSLARPGGNVTGFSSFEPGIAGKWLQYLKEIAPATQRVSVLFNPNTAPYSLFWSTLETTAPTMGLSIVRAEVQDASTLEAAIGTQAATPGGGILVLPDSFLYSHRTLIYALAVKHRLPAVWPIPFHAASGGLVAYGPDFVDQFRRAATYVDRILRSTSTPAELPVQQPTKFELKINVKTAKAIGIFVPPTLLALADEVIE